MLPATLSMWREVFSPRFNRTLKNAYLLCSPHPSSLRRTSKYASLIRISGASYLGIFEHPAYKAFFSKLLDMTEGGRLLFNSLMLLVHPGVEWVTSIYNFFSPFHSNPTQPPLITPPSPS